MVEKGRDILYQLNERIGLTVIQQGWLDAIPDPAEDAKRRNEKAMGKFPSFSHSKARLSASAVLDE